jgi:hypothetical protein
MPADLAGMICPSSFPLRPQAEVLIVVPMVWPLVLTDGAAVVGGGGAVRSAGRSSCFGAFACCVGVTGTTGLLFETLWIAMMSSS